MKSIGAGLSWSGRNNLFAIAIASSNSRLRLLGRILCFAELEGGGAQCHVICSAKPMMTE
jgi:hypothetical protein